MTKGQDQEKKVNDKNIDGVKEDEVVEDMEDPTTTSGVVGTSESDSPSSRVVVDCDSVTASTSSTSTDVRSSSNRSRFKGKKDQNKQQNDDRTTATSLPGAVAVAGIGQASGTTTNVEGHHNNNNNDDGNEQHDIENNNYGGTNGHGVEKTDRTLESIVEAELVEQNDNVVRDVGFLGPVYDAEKVPPMEESTGDGQCLGSSKKKIVWASAAAIIVLVAIILVLVGVFVIADDDGQQQQQQQPQEVDQPSSTTSSSSSSSSTITVMPTNAPTFDPSVPRWVESTRGHIEWNTYSAAQHTGRGDIGFGATIDMSSDGNVIAVAAPFSSHNITPFAGEVYVYEWIDDSVEVDVDVQGGRWVLRGRPLGGPDI